MLPQTEKKKGGYYFLAKNVLQSTVLRIKKKRRGENSRALELLSRIQKDRTHGCPRRGCDARGTGLHSWLSFQKTRDGRWQKRWFETNGCFLTYYKNKKMAKLLAALNLPQVGDIKLLDATHPEDGECCRFNILNAVL